MVTRPPPDTPVSATGRLTASTDALPAATAWSVVLALVAAVGVADTLTGARLSLSIFYVAPVSLAAWRLGRRVAFVVSLLAAAVWIMADVIGREERLFDLLTIWNGLVRLAFFVLVTVLIAQVRALLGLQVELARVDPLTGLANVRALWDALGAEAARSRRYAHPLAVAYLDLDDFKVINDTMGHTAGDEALRVAASTLRGRLRSTDLVARMGGDEFVVMLPETDAAAARAVFATLPDHVAHAGAARGLELRCSVGVVVYAEPPEDPEALVHAADQAMYAAKRAGKGRVVYDVRDEAVNAGG